MDCQLLGTAFQSGVNPDPASPGHSCALPGLSPPRAVTHVLRSQLQVCQPPQHSVSPMSTGMFVWGTAFDP